MTQSQLAPQLEPEAEVAAPRYRILIVEDNQEQREILKTQMERQGFEAVTAETGGQCIELARRERPHLVLMDIRLPDMDGLQVCRQLDDDPSTCQIPVILLSGMERPDIIRRSRAAGCHYFVRKPYDPNALLILAQHAIAEELGF